MADFIELLEVLEGVQSGQLTADPAEFALHLQSHRDRFLNLLRYKVGWIDHFTALVDKRRILHFRVKIVPGF